MKTCIICPIPDLRRYVGDQYDYHLILAHLLDNSPEGRLYRTFYSERASAGDFVMIDNGAKELGSGMSLKHLLAEARMIGAKEIVLPDVRYDGLRTTALGIQELSWLRSAEGQEAYERARWPRIMVVPQGTDPVDWANCLDALAYSVETTLGEMAGPSAPKLTVGVAYHYDHMFVGGLQPLLEHPVLFDTAEVHLLGWTRRLESLKEIAQAYGSRIRSVDSSRPIVWGMAGLECGKYEDYPQRPVDFFTRSTDLGYAPEIMKNIAMFKEYACDVD